MNSLEKANMNRVGETKKKTRRDSERQRSSD